MDGPGLHSRDRCEHAPFFRSRITRYRLIDKVEMYRCYLPLSGRGRLEVGEEPDDVGEVSRPLLGRCRSPPVSQTAPPVTGVRWQGTTCIGVGQHSPKGPTAN